MADQRPDARLVAGPIYRPGTGIERGWLRHEAGRIVETGEGAPPARPDARGFILPAPVNAHTHVGDRVGRGIPLVGMRLDQVVKPPHGLKHRILRETPPQELLQGMRQAVHELLRSGCRHFLDFRERGIEGIRMLRQACEGTSARPVIFGRPVEGWPEEEMDAVLSIADGLGLSGLGDVSDDAPERAARAAKRRGKRFALHFSEASQEDVDRALALKPDFLVHVSAAPRADLEKIAEQRVPVVMCPRSNAIFGVLPPLPTLLELDIPLALGSDNAMFHSLDVLLDARFLWQSFPDVPRETLLDIAVAGGRRVLDGSAPRTWLQPGSSADFVVLEPQGEAPLDAVFGEQPPRLAEASWNAPAKD